MSLYTPIVANILFPLHERLKGHDTTRILRELEATQWYAPDRLRALQAARLKALLQAVAGSVPFYRDRVGDPAAAAKTDDPLELLSTLPIVDKTLIRSHATDWCARGADRLIALQTSGSSGEPLHFRLGLHRISFDIAAKWRATRWWDVDVGDREMVLWNSALENDAQDRVRRFRDWLFRSRLVPTRELGPAQLDRVLDDMRRFRPKMLFGYPSALARLAWRALDKGRPLNDVGVRVAFCTSEVLRPEWRQAIHEAFGCGIANEYGARDAGFIARECPAGSLHVTAEEVIVEVVDAQGRPVPPGVEGDILVTNLVGPEFPFIRYRTGDRGRLAATPCACGRGLPVLEEVAGRSNDGLVGENGAWIHGSAINHLMREIPGLKAYRIVQDALQSLEILLVLDQPLAESVSTRLAGHVRRLLGPGTGTRIRQVDDIPPLANGKFRHIVCKVSPQDGRQTP
ncbi:phenylacetate--CoA ligase family protein [Pseudothauera rhizosphaerae]|uniref:Phenylacetate--CoA ligase family protein n=1 Tax=Pseudothauera rhizosphaerae TaxID=2565932 RepID=A0A4S4API8_9RHOO|nr:AMP-binding protein [Pseudothauera rhizosphaerae]THF61605.1 phenylacetate--CoA ligase family protein [Pseudothauera rhizosphaerae]